MADLSTRSDWMTEEEYWQSNFKNRPYVQSDRDFAYYRPAYRFGYEASDRYQGEDWDDVESNLRRDWDAYADRGQSTWEQIKGAVRDAWDRVTGNRRR
jgi:hypothetical protein